MSDSTCLDSPRGASGRDTSCSTCPDTRWIKTSRTVAAPPAPWTRRQDRVTRASPLSFLSIWVGVTKWERTPTGQHLELCKLRTASFRLRLGQLLFGAPKELLATAAAGLWPGRSALGRNRVRVSPALGSPPPASPARCVPVRREVAPFGALVAPHAEPLGILPGGRRGRGPPRRNFRRRGGPPGWCVVPRPHGRGGGWTPVAAARGRSNFKYSDT